MPIDPAHLEDDAETFAAYMARYLVARHGYSVDLPNEAGPLAAACDRVLVRRSGNVVSVACIVDREARPGARFGLSPADAAAVVRLWTEAAARQADGGGRRTRFGRGRAVVLLTVYEVGDGIDDPGAERRLDDHRVVDRRGRAPIVQLILIDPRRGTVLARPHRVWGRDVGIGWLRKLVGRPRLSAEDLAPPAVAADVGRAPVLTGALLAALVAIFVAETLLPVEPWTGSLHASVRTLLAFGGVDRALVVGDGQWWRMATAPLLHGDALHILFNGLALWLVGRLSERLMGVAWFAATFAVSALAGSALSIVVNPPNLLSVGASGAIVGLFVASLVLSFHFPMGPLRSRLQSSTLGTIVPALVPILSTGKGATIDFGAHFGGALAGLAMGLVMLALWPRSRARPRFAGAAGAVAVAGLVLAVAAVPSDLDNYRKVPLYAALFQPWPATDAEARAEAYDIITAKPRDPRGHFVQGLALIDAKDLPGAEAELRRALAEPEMLGLLGPHYESRIRLVLGAVLRDEHEPEAARQVEAPACAAEKDGGPMSADILRLKLCS